MNGGAGATNLTSKHGGSVGASVAWSQPPTSPTPVNRQQQQQQQLNGPMSPTGGSGLVVGQKLVYASMVPQTGKKNDDGELLEREREREG